jgi:catalase
VGVLELNRNPENYFAEVEQAAFYPSNLPPGVGVSPDKMLQARLFVYPDAQRYRIGANYQALSVNRPKNGAKSFGGPIQDTTVKEPIFKISGDARRYDGQRGNDNYSQAGALYNIMSEEQKDSLTSTIAGTMQSIPRDLAIKNIEHFKKCDPDYGNRIEKKLD